MALVTMSLILICTVLISADYWFVEQKFFLENIPEPTVKDHSLSVVVSTSSSSSAKSQATAISSSQSSKTSSTPTLVRKGIKKKKVTDPLRILTSLGFEVGTTKEESFLADLLRETPPTTVVILTNNDRIALLSWVQQGSVKSLLSSLKEALLPSFSNDVRDLIDTTTHEEGKPVIDTLSFIDPSLSPDRITFIRVRELLFEIHIPIGKEKDIEDLMMELQK